MRTCKHSPRRPPQPPFNNTHDYRLLISPSSITHYHHPRTSSSITTTYYFTHQLPLPHVLLPLDITTYQVTTYYYHLLDTSFYRPLPLPVTNAFQKQLPRYHDDHHNHRSTTPTTTAYLYYLLVSPTTTAYVHHHQLLPPTTSITNYQYYYHYYSFFHDLDPQLLLRLLLLPPITNIYQVTTYHDHATKFFYCYYHP